jgi:hypothetical protein
LTFMLMKMVATTWFYFICSCSSHLFCFTEKEKWMRIRRRQIGARPISTSREIRLLIYFRTWFWFSPFPFQSTLYLKKGDQLWVTIAYLDSRFTLVFVWQQYRNQFTQFTGLMLKVWRPFEVQHSKTLTTRNKTLKMNVNTNIWTRGF